MNAINKIKAFAVSTTTMLLLMCSVGCSRSDNAEMEKLREENRELKAQIVKLRAKVDAAGRVSEEVSSACCAEPKLGIEKRESNYHDKQMRQKFRHERKMDRHNSEFREKMRDPEFRKKMKDPEFRKKFHEELRKKREESRKKRFQEREASKKSLDSKSENR